MWYGGDAAPTYRCHLCPGTRIYHVKAEYNDHKASRHVLGENALTSDMKKLRRLSTGFTKPCLATEGAALNHVQRRIADAEERLRRTRYKTT